MQVSTHDQVTPAANKQRLKEMEREKNSLT